MPNNDTFLFTESAFGGLPQAAAPDVSPVASERVADKDDPAPSFVESLGFPMGTNPALLAKVLDNTCATPPGTRVDHLRSPGVLSRLFSQSAAEASYALAILAIVESPAYEATLARLKAVEGADPTTPPSHP